MGNRDLRIQSYMRIRPIKSMKNSFTYSLCLICAWRAHSTLMPCIGTMNRPGQSKAPQGRRTPKPGGSSSDCGQRASVLECGGPPPLSMRARARNSCGSWKAPLSFLRMHWDPEPRFCLTLTRNLTLTLRSSIKSRIKSKKSSVASAWSPGFSRCKAFEPPEGGTPNQPWFMEINHGKVRIRRRDCMASDA